MICHEKSSLYKYPQKQISPVIPFMNSFVMGVPCELIGTAV
ncbi:MAG: hypothetical protein ACTS73_04225 [Arsenophonus sp. NEOnobi-MAG3]